jgi:hypothetical protein
MLHGSIHTPTSDNELDASYRCDACDSDFTTDPYVVAPPGKLYPSGASLEIGYSWDGSWWEA